MSKLLKEPVTEREYGSRMRGRKRKPCTDPKALRRLAKQELSLRDTWNRLRHLTGKPPIEAKVLHRGLRHLTLDQVEELAK